MSTQEGCTERYHGTHVGALVYLVGVGTEHEQVFPAYQAREAGRKSRELKVPVVRVPAKDLCHDAVAPIFA